VLADRILSASLNAGTATVGLDQSVDYLVRFKNPGRISAADVFWAGMVEFASCKPLESTSMPDDDAGASPRVPKPPRAIVEIGSPDGPFARFFFER